MSQDKTGKQVKVVPIDIKGKYVFIVPTVPSDLEGRDGALSRFADMVREWMESDSPIFVISDSVKLVRVDEEVTPE